MHVVSLSNHVVRKALQLSLNEMAVLCDIKQMSQDPKYGFWCTKSKDKIGEWLDLSRATVFNCIKTLEEKGYLEKSNIGLRPSTFIYNLDLAQDEIGIYIKNNDVALISAKMKSILDGQSKNYTIQNLDTPSKIYTTTVQNLDGNSLNFRPKNIIDNNKEIHTQESEPKFCIKSEKGKETYMSDFVAINKTSKLWGFDSEKYNQSFLCSFLNDKDRILVKTGISEYDCIIKDSFLSYLLTNHQSHYEAFKRNYKDVQDVLLNEFFRFYNLEKFEEIKNVNRALRTTYDILLNKNAFSKKESITTSPTVFELTEEQKQALRT
jgi:biotin operon repressor